MVAGQQEVAIPDLTQNTSPQIEEGAEVVEVDVMTVKSDETDEAETDERETDEAQTDEAEGNSLVGKVEADNLIGLEREDIKASDQPLPTLAKGKEAHVLASLQNKNNSLVEMRRMGEQVIGFMVKENGVLVQLKLIAPGKEVKMMVVPTIRRKEILDVNRLKSWHTPTANLSGVVAVQDSKSLQGRYHWEKQYDRSSARGIKQDTQ